MDVTSHMELRNKISNKLAIAAIKLSNKITKNVRRNEMKMDQIAFYAADEKAEAIIKNLFGLQNAEWKHDQVTALSRFYNDNLPEVDEVTNRAYLQFNYDLGIELEIIRYDEDSEHWHVDQVWKMQVLGANYPFLSHVGIHLEEGEDFPVVDEKLFTLVQETWTKHHTNPYVVEKKRLYHYRIYKCKGSHSYIKYIKRIAGEK